jgi:hypothetical protein
VYEDGAFARLGSLTLVLLIAATCPPVPLEHFLPLAITADNYSSQQSRLSVAGEQLGTAGVKPAAPTGVAIRLHP